MKKLKIIAIVFAFVFIAYLIFYKYSDEILTLKTAAYYSIPGACDYDIYSSSYDIISKDNYGRVMYLFTFDGNYSMYNRDHVKAVVICQKYNDNYVYFYENVSYIMVDGMPEADDKEIIQLQNENDWNKPLETSKMTKRTLINAYTGVPEYPYNVIDCEKREKAFKHKIRLKQGKTIDSDICDMNFNGKQLYWVYIKDINTNECSDVYFMILDSEGNYDEDNYILHIDDVFDCRDELIEIKKNNGWYED